jgi:signal transduction histidine kinase/DNA-binding NarL/FixJ family response regulator
MQRFVHGNMDYVVFALASALLLLCMGMWLRRYRRETRISMLSWVLLIGILAPGWVLVNDAGVHERIRLQKMIQGFAPTYAHELEQMGHQDITLHTPPNDPAYLAMIAAQIRWLKANPYVSDIYTFRKRADGLVMLIVDSETDYDSDGKYLSPRESRTQIGEIYPEATKALDRAFYGEAVFDAEPVTDRWGTWISAYVPMYGDSGEVESVLGVDFDAKQWLVAQAQARTNAMVLLVVVIVILVASASVTSILRADIQHRQTAAGELRRAKEAAEAATEAKTLFLANMSHEIRAPMTAILGYAELLLDPSQSHHDRVESVQTIQRNGEHLLTIINDILDLSKIEAGRMVVERIACNPAIIVAEICSMVRSRAKAKRLEFDARLDGPIPTTIKTDPTRLRQILLNLTSNAIKFTESGRIELVIRLRMKDDIPRLIFDVIDTGIGLTSDQQKVLFQPFSQADPSHTRRFGGTGLGLSISRRLAHALGGGISLRSEYGIGSTFTVDIDPGPIEGVPLVHSFNEREESSNDAALPSAGIRLDGLSVLLAEDGADNQRLINFHLSKAGATVNIVENGQLACDAIAKANAAGTPFDVVLMDMQMPILDGYSAASLLRQQGYGRPIIALTAHAMHGDREKCVRAGCDDYATKPLDKSLLLSMVAKWSAIARSNSEADSLQQVAGTTGSQAAGRNSTSC